MIHLSMHAQRRMRQRGIEAWEVEYVIDHPGTQYSSEQDATRTVILGETLSGRRLKVVVVSDDQSQVVTEPVARTPEAICEVPGSARVRSTT